MTKNKAFPWILVLLWMGLIFYLSHQPASQSAQLSRGLTVTIINIIEKLAPNIDFDFGAFHHFIRKNAHFFAYLILGLLVANAMRVRKTKRALAAIILCTLYALSDEFHQTFIPARAGQWTDVLIDSMGSAFGVFSYQIALFMKKR